MGVADLQNPIANMPHIQQLQVSHQQQAQAAPVAQAKTRESEVRRQLTTVPESEEQKENQRIREKETARERRNNSRRPPAQPASIRPPESKPAPPCHPKAQDGIRGQLLDTEA